MHRIAHLADSLLPFERDDAGRTSSCPRSRPARPSWRCEGSLGSSLGLVPADELRCCYLHSQEHSCRPRGTAGYCFRITRTILQQEFTLSISIHAKFPKQSCKY